MMMGEILGVGGISENLHSMLHLGIDPRRVPVHTSA